MKTKDTDRRVKRTKKRLKESLTQLLSQKSIKDISVKELTDLADINRCTFYLHYQDIFDMINSVETEMLEEFSNILNNRPEDEKTMPIPILTDVFNFFAKNAQLCRILLGENGDMAFMDKVKQLVRDKCFYEWMSFYSEKNAENFEYYYSFIVSGCLGVFMTWLDGGMKQSPEQMAVLTGQLVLYGAKVIY